MLYTYSLPIDPHFAFFIELMMSKKESNWVSELIFFIFNELEVIFFFQISNFIYLFSPLEFLF